RGAQIAGLGAAAAGADAPDQIGNADDDSLDDVALEGRVGEAADRERGPDDEDVDRLVEVPLLLEKVVRPGEALLQRGGGAGPAPVGVVRDSDAEHRDQSADQQ